MIGCGTWIMHNLYLQVSISPDTCHTWLLNTT